MTHGIITDTDLHFKIDPVTRDITNLSDKKSLVQYDHNSEKFTFEVPRFVEGHDMSLSTRIEIHYLNISTDGRTQNEDVYDVTEKAVSESEDTLIFAWEISGNATQLSGTLNFVVRFKCLNDDSTIKYSWGTRPLKGILIDESIDNGSSVMDRYSDIITEWEQRLFTINNDGVTNITEAKNNAIREIENSADEILNQREILETKIEDTKTESRQIFANALKGSASGNHIHVSDVSPLEHIVKGKISGVDNPENVIITRLGENLFDVFNTEWSSSIGRANAELLNDGTVRVIVIKTSDYINVMGVGIDLSQIDGNTLYVSADVKTGTSGNQPAFLFRVLNTETGVSSNVGSAFKSVDGKIKGFLTITDSIRKNYNCITVLLYYNANDTAGWKIGDYVDFSNIMISTSDSEYEPYDKETYTPNIDGTVNIKSLSSSMQIFSDTSDVTIDIEYNRDVNKAFSEMQNAIISLGGNV